MNNMLILTDEDSDEDDEMFEHLAMHGRALKRIRPRPDNFEKWSEEELFVRFRLTKATALTLFGYIVDEISTASLKNDAVLPMNRLLLALRFYATGSMLIITAGDFAGVHKSTACSILHKVSTAIARLRPRFIKFPETAEEIEAVTRGLYNVAPFPLVTGAIDCSHVMIQSPGGDQAETFRNRKGTFSINVQTIFGPKLEILDIVARWPGSTHDRTIFSNSRIKARFKGGEMGNRVLVGELGYTLAPFMMTPLRNPVTRAEQLYNESQIRTRNAVERQYGVWKSRFPVLAYGMRVRLDHVLTIIVATAVLHNLACSAAEDVPPRDPELGEVNLEEGEMPADPFPANLEGDGAVRRELIYNYFGML